MLSRSLKGIVYKFAQKTEANKFSYRLDSQYKTNRRSTFAKATLDLSFYNYYSSKV